MEVVTKIVKKRKDKRASLPTLFEVLINSSFANEDKGLEMEWIDREIEYATQKLEEGRFPNGWTLVVIMWRSCLRKISLDWRRRIVFQLSILFQWNPKCTGHDQLQIEFVLELEID